MVLLLLPSSRQHQELGYKYSTKSAITVAVCDASIPEAKKDILAKADGLVDKIDKQYKRGYISREEKSKKFIEIWNNATDEVTEALKANLDPYNPINMMADSVPVFYQPDQTAGRYAWTYRQHIRFNN